MHMICPQHKTLCPRFADLQIPKKGTGKPKFFGRFPAFFVPNNYPQAAPAAHYIQQSPAGCASGPLHSNTEGKHSGKSLLRFPPDHVFLPHSTLAPSAPTWNPSGVTVLVSMAPLTVSQ